MPVAKKISRRQVLKQGWAAAAAGIAVPQFVSCRQPTRDHRSAQIAPHVAQRPDRRGDHRLRTAQRATRHRQRRPGRAAQVRPDRRRGRFQHAAGRGVGEVLQVPGLPGLPGAAGSQGSGRRRVRHAGALALPALHPCLPGGQGHLRRTAAVAHHPRGAGDGRRRSASTNACSRPANSNARTPRRARPWN